MKVFPVDILLVGEGVRYRLKEDMLIHGVFVPKGFITDGASVPRFLWGLFPPVSDYFAAAILHDYLLSLNTDWKEAEAAFKRALRDDRIGAVRSWLMLNAVRLNGVLKGKR